MFYGFANSQPFLHISDVPKYHQCGIYFIKNNMFYGFANGQPFSYIEDVS